MTTAIDTTETELHWEAVGSGPAVLLIPGTPGYGGQFEALVDALASDRLVVTYDRRGTARSRRRPEWHSTSVGEQADDAEAVLAAIGVSAATVFGTSNGGLIALELAARRAARVTRVLVHEAPLVSVLADPAAVGAAIGAVVGPAMQTGGPAAALEAFLRFAFGDGVVDAWSSDLRNCMLADAAMVFDIEMPAFQGYVVDRDRLASATAAIEVLVGEQQQLPFFHEAAQWLADACSTAVRTAPGAHGAHFTDPIELAEIVRN